MQFLYQNWLALLSLVIAVFGGVRGILDLINEVRSHPKLAAYLLHITPIDSLDTGGKKIGGLILDLRIGNKGREALLPLAFHLECKLAGHWEKMIRGTISEGFTINFENHFRRFENVNATDISLCVDSIKRDSPVNGLLIFVSKNIEYSLLAKEFKNMPIRLICTDLFKVRHQIVLNKDFI